MDDTPQGTPVLSSAGVPPAVSGASRPRVLDDVVSPRFGHVTVRERGRLPHWESDGSTYFVTFRLGDSLPLHVVEDYMSRRAAILARAEQARRGLTLQEREELRLLFQERIESFLDAGRGACYLAKPEIAEMVAKALEHFSGSRYQLFAWCVMPNHVHVVFCPLPGYTLEDVLHSWKSFTSKQANRVLNRQGEFWHREYYDHLVRDEEDFLRVVEYVANNPQKAGLKSWHWVWVTKELLRGRDAPETAGETPALPTAKMPNVPQSRIRLIVADIDGCLSQGSATPIPIALLERLADFNRRSRTDPDVPAITFCTGRPQPYVECLLQIIEGYMPALCENGTVCYEPAEHRVRISPGFGAREKDVLNLLRDRVQQELVSDNVSVEPGKMTHLTVLVSPPLTPRDVLPRARAVAAEFGDYVRVVPTRISLHFLFPHLNKGAGLRWLSTLTGIPLEQMAGIGDSALDVAFLSLTGLACAPSNASQEAKDVSGYVSGCRDALATIEFIDYVVERNRSLSRGSRSV